MAQSFCGARRMRVPFGQFVKLSPFACGKGEFLGVRPTLDLAFSTRSGNIFPSANQRNETTVAFGFGPTLSLPKPAKSVSSL